MIARIIGKVIKKENNAIILESGGFHYEVLAAQTVIEKVLNNQNVELVTYHYHHLEPSRSVPILIGFLTEIEREFFEKFITVSGIGPRAAIKSLIKPVSLIAKAIDCADVSFLRSLPGIGQQRAKEIIAKLQGKVGKFALIQDSREESGVISVSNNLEEEALEVLLQLQYKKNEAIDMIKNALSRSSAIQNVEDLLNEVYRQRKS
ncbi:MAG: Holliday junction branch migration protein RuvA [Candidatus Omnitrophota bacterium]